MKLLRRLLSPVFWLLLSLCVAGLLAIVGASLYFSPGLPDVHQLQDTKLQTPLRIYTRDGKLIGEYGDQRRIPVTYDEIPETFVDALLAAEDSNFFSHPGIDPKGLARAAVQLASSGSIQSGGSTITMQVARNYLLTLDQTFTRKIREILLSLQMEEILSKQEIMELYVNKIFLGHRAYGIAAAARTYYDKSLDELTLAEQAMLAGLPKAPSSFNPLTNPQRALIRRNWILLRMKELGYIEPQAYDEAVKAPITAARHYSRPEVQAPYVAEMARSFAVDRFGDKAYTDNVRITTTLDSSLQPMARDALTKGLIAYDPRHGWRGVEESDIAASLAEAQDQTDQAGLEEELSKSPEVLETAKQAAQKSEKRIAGIDRDVSNWLKVLDRTPDYGPLKAAIVVESTGKQMKALLADATVVTLDWDGLKWAREYKSAKWRGGVPGSAAEIAKAGDLVRVIKQDDGYRLGQLPDAQSAIVSLDPESGAILALQGGFSYSASKFNRAIQARRQAGSIFKPFVYLSGLEQAGMSPATIINNAPVVLQDGGKVWRPENAGGKFTGPTRIRVGLYRSLNLVSVRLLQTVGLDKTLDFLVKLGFQRDELPNGLSLALGSASLTPLEMARGYAVLSNGGFRVEPWYIDTITRGDDETDYEAHPPVACANCAPGMVTVNRDGRQYPLAERVASPEAMYLIRDMMQDVIKRGTGRGALALGRDDLAGKTGTTNDQRDAWFSGFNSKLVATVWVGKDSNDTLAEYGAQAALPIWVDYMRGALKGMPSSTMERPENIVTATIDPDSGKRLRSGQSGGISELFRKDNLPPYKERTIRKELEQESGSEGTGTFEAIF